MHHVFASRFLIDSLHEHGFSCSYSEVQKFERSAAANHGNELPPLYPGQRLQHVADNADHNIRTIDGHGTFHGMGIIAVVTPGKVKSKPIPRVHVTVDEVKRIGRINISYFKSQPSNNKPLTYGELTNRTEDHTVKADVLWKTYFLLCCWRPAWSGMMQGLHDAEYPGGSAVMFMPLIDMNPNDLSCVYTTFHFVCRKASKLGTIPIVTFDQPLWWKANYTPGAN